MTTLEQLQILEKYIRLGNLTSEKVISMSLDKIIQREIQIQTHLKDELERQLEIFEKNYALKSEDFHLRFDAGRIRDDADFSEWAATFEMYKNVQERLQILHKNS